MLTENTPRALQMFKEMQTYQTVPEKVNFIDLRAFERTEKKRKVTPEKGVLHEEHKLQGEGARAAIACRWSTNHGSNDGKSTKNTCNSTRKSICSSDIMFGNV